MSNSLRYGGRAPARPDPQGVVMTVEPYEVRVLGALGGAGQDAFRDVIVSTQPATTVLTGSFDQAGLHAGTHANPAIRAESTLSGHEASGRVPLWRVRPSACAVAE